MTCRATFETPLILRFLGETKGRSTYRLTEPLVFRLPNGSGVINVPEGFVTDFASVPRALWWLLPPTGTYSQAAVLHDFICRTRQHAYTRFYADAIFRLAMQASGVPLWKRWVMWAAVRVFGPRFKRRMP